MTTSSELLKYQLRSGAVPFSELPATPFDRLLCHPRVIHFGDACSEYQAAQGNGAVFDVSDRTQIEINGSDAQSFLHKFCTNDITRLTPGNGCEAFVTNVKGRILAHLFVFVTEDAVWIDSPATDEDVLIAHLDQYLFSEDVRLQGHSKALGDLLVTGTTCIDRLSSTEPFLNTLDFLQHTTISIQGLTVTARRVDLLSCPAFLLSTRRHDLVTLWKTIVAAGMQPAGAQAFHALRIETAFPLYGIDLSDDNLAQEAGRTTQAISFTKGCYLGQEPIARIDAVGHINRQVSRLRLETSEGVTTPAAVLSSDGSEIGVVTSSMVVPGQERTVALALLKTSHAQPDMAVRVESGGQSVAATVF